MAEATGSESSESEVTDEIRRLMDAAIAVRQGAYCPYSKFYVGAAVLADDGTIFTGSNVENASYGMTVCAERVAIWNAVSAGHRRFHTIAVCADVKGEFKASCGACRQVMVEFCHDTELSIYAVRPDKTWRRIPFSSLLPDAFTPASLGLGPSTNSMQ